VGMTGYRDAYKLDIPMQMPMAMAMAMASVMISSELKSPSLPPSHHGSHAITVDFTEITVFNSDYELHLVRVTNGRLNDWMSDIPEVEICRTVLLWMFPFSLFFTSF